jgi:hypothetical protein
MAWLTFNVRQNMKPTAITLCILAGVILGAVFTAVVYERAAKRQAARDGIAMSAAGQLAIQLMAESDLRYTESVLMSFKSGLTEVGISRLETFAADKAKQIKSSAAELAKHPEVKIQRTNEPNKAAEPTAMTQTPSATSTAPLSHL